MANERYQEMITLENAQDQHEKKALFWILSQNENLFKRKHIIYDFDVHTICPECLGKEYFSSSETAMIKLGFNLYDGYMHHNNDVADIFSVLDDKNFEICLSAIKIRYNKM